MKTICSQINQLLLNVISSRIIVSLGIELVTLTLISLVASSTYHYVKNYSQYLGHNSLYLIM